jgi:hypothetical protein
VCKKVREQASVVATRIRHAVKDEKERQILLLAQQLKVHFYTMLLAFVYCSINTLFIHLISYGKYVSDGK